MRDEFTDPGVVGDAEETVDAGLRPRALDEFVGQRELKEHLAIVLEAARRRSQFLKENFQRLYDTEKARLNSILPSKFHTDTPPGRAILVAMSFDTWRMLREDEHLSASETVEAVKQMVGDIVARLDD